MIKKLQRKIVVITMAIIGVVALILCGIVGFYVTNTKYQNLYYSMDVQMEKYIHPELYSPTKTQIGVNNSKIIVQIDVCIVAFTPKTEQLETLTTSTYIDDDILKESISHITKNKTKTGVISSLFLVYSTFKEDDVMYISFSDMNYILTELSKIWIIILLSYAAIMAGVLVVSLILSRVAIQPIKDTIEEQKRFIADASHELKTPLTVISANNKILLSNQLKSQEEQLEWLDSNEEEIKHMNSIISEMLILAQGERLSEITKTNINLSKIVNKLCLQFEAVAFDKNIELNCNIEDDIIVSCDEKMIKQLFMILIENAIKYEPNNGRVSIKLEKPTSESSILTKNTFSVNNKGTFISPEVIPHLFERFYRADASRNSNGTGLGLAIAKNIADLHETTIKIVSNGENGTTFSVSL